jgi:D-alanyl-D-alanine carboxypeptidase/D-alanyl-D-alanine-endopeptidase (penicillin-binding protein 4)
MSRRLALFLALLAARSWAATPDPTPPAKDPAAFRTAIAARIAAPRFAHAQWGVQIVSLDTGVELFGHQADRLFIPASNTKLYTAALALDRLGPDFRIRTSLYSTRRPTRRGVLAADLVLFGRGDPTFLAPTNGADLHTAFMPLADALLAAGVRRIRGDLIADETFFPGEPVGSGWDWDDFLWYYGAEVSALSINNNALDVILAPDTVPGRPARITLAPPSTALILSNLCVTAPAGAPRRVHFDRSLASPILRVTGQIPIGASNLTESIAVPHPAAWFAQTFRETLERRGVRIDGRIRVVSDPYGSRQEFDPARWLELAAVESPPLTDLLARMLKPSQNQQAQLLLLQAGAAANRPVATNAATPSPQPVPSLVPREPAETAGIRALDAFLKDAGVSGDEALIEEGSGLTRRNLVSPAATVQLLRFMDHHRYASVYRQALPVAGVDGTLRSRMRDTPAAGNARAKTGTLRYVNSLSGYVTSAAGERFAFSLFLNNYRPATGARPPRADLDDIVTTVAALDWRTPSPTGPAPANGE